MPGLIRTQSIIDISLGSYTTNFPATENPISDSGKWVNGGATGGSWNNVRTTTGLAFGSAIVSTTDDDIACLTTNFPGSQFVQGTVFKAGGYNPSNSHEIELLLRFVISSGVARGYEITWGIGGVIQIVRWNGGLGDFDVLTTNSIGAAVTGDVLRGEMVGSAITVKLNGSTVASTTNSTWTDGQPGMGFFPRTGATLSSFGWSSFSAGGL